MSIQIKLTPLPRVRGKGKGQLPMLPVETLVLNAVSE